MAPFSLDAIGIVIDFLHNDTTSLSACSLVCNDWLPFTRYHLFRHVDIIHYRSKWPQKRRILMNGDSFLELLRNQHQTIRSSIRSVTLQTDRLLIPVLEAMCNLSIESLDISFATKEALTYIAWNYGHLRDFSLVIPADSEIDEEFLKIISSIRGLRSLLLYASYTKKVKNISHSPSVCSLSWAGFAHLQTLRLYLCQTEDLLEHFLLLDAFPSLKTFELGMYRCLHRGWGPVKHLNAFLSAHGDSLEHLRLIIHYMRLSESRDTSPDPDFGNINLTPLTQLQKLDIEMHDLDAISTMLSGLSPESPFKELRIHLVPWYIPDWYDKEVKCDRPTLWRALGTTLEMEQMSVLKRLDIKIPLRVYGDDVKFAEECLGAWLASRRNGRIGRVTGIPPQQPMRMMKEIEWD